MFGFGSKLPISEDIRQWTDIGFGRLSRMLGTDAMFRAQVVLPQNQFFPDAFDGSKTSVMAMAARIAEFMRVPADSFMVEIYAEAEVAWQDSMPARGTVETKDAAGLYFVEPDDGRFVVGVHAKQLKDPSALVATLAHELAHVLLLGGGLLDRDSQDMEPLTDLATVYLGLGVFTAGAAFQFKQWSNDVIHGWTWSRQGYLPEPAWGYALTKFAHLRGEAAPGWAKELPTNIQVYMGQSLRWLKREAGSARWTGDMLGRRNLSFAPLRFS